MPKPKQIGNQGDCTIHSLTVKNTAEFQPSSGGFGLQVRSALDERTLEMAHHKVVL